MAFNINHMTPVLFGEGTSLQAGEKLKDYGCKKVLLLIGLPGHQVNSYSPVVLEIVFPHDIHFIVIFVSFLNKRDIYLLLPVLLQNLQSFLLCLDELP